MCTAQAVTQAVSGLGFDAAASKRTLDLVGTKVARVARYRGKVIGDGG